MLFRSKISAIPLGGYVKFPGQMHIPSDDQTAAPAKERPERWYRPKAEPRLPQGQNFGDLPRWQRALIVAAGPIANLIIAAIIIATVNATYGVATYTGRITEVEHASPAERAGISSGDRVVRWNGQSFDGSSRLIMHILANPDEQLAMTVDRDHQRHDVALGIERVERVIGNSNRSDVGRIGVTFENGWRKATNPVDALTSAIDQTKIYTTLQITTMRQLLTGKRSVTEMSGPVRMAKLSGEMYRVSWPALFMFVALVSIALAITNLMPIPTLDGGYLAVYAVETVKRSPLSTRALKRTMVTGYSMIILLSIFAFSNDIIQITAPMR